MPAENSLYCVYVEAEEFVKGPLPVYVVAPSEAEARMDAAARCCFTHRRVVAEGIKGMPDTLTLKPLSGFKVENLTEMDRVTSENKGTK